MERSLRSKLLRRFPARTASENDAVNLRVLESVRVGNTVVIADGTLVKGSVASVEQRGHLGKGGKLGRRVDSTTTEDGKKVKLRASKGKGDTGTVGSTIALSLLISPPSYFDGATMQ